MKQLDVKLYAEKDGTTIVVIKGAQPDTQDMVTGILRNLLQTEIPAPKDIEDIVPVSPDTDDTPPSLADAEELVPDFLKEPEETDAPAVENVGDFVVHMTSGKYREKAMTIAEIFAVDKAWLVWMKDKYQPKTPQQKELIEKISQFLATQG